MDRSLFLIPIERDYLDELMKKAAAWDRHQAALKKNLVRPQDGIYPSNGLDENIDVTRVVPLDQTIIVTNLPYSISGAELMNSFLAIGGIRCYQTFLVPGKGPNNLTALITFVNPDSAKNYLSYISNHGFFLSKRLPVGYNPDARAGEYVYISLDTKFQCLFKHAPGVTVKPWFGTEKISGKRITGYEGGYCNVSHAIKMEGATRCLTILPGIEPRKLQEELEYLIAVPELRIESNRLRLAIPPQKWPVTIIKFFSVRDAVMVKRYLSLLKSFSGPDGKTIKYVKSPTDIPTENLGWHNFPKPEAKTLTPTSAKSVSDITKTKSDISDLILKVNEPLNAENSGLRNCSYDSAGSCDGDSDCGSDTREISFSLAKEAFLPYIATSPNRACFTSLCHTPTSGDCTPAHLEGHSHPEERPVLGNEFGIPLTSSTTTVVTGTGSNSSPHHETILGRKKYPHEIYLPKRETSRKYTDSYERLNPRNIEDSRSFTSPRGLTKQSPNNMACSTQYRPLQDSPIETTKLPQSYKATENLNRLEITAQNPRGEERLLNSQQVVVKMKTQIENNFGP